MRQSEVVLFMVLVGAGPGQHHGRRHPPTPFTDSTCWPRSPRAGTPGMAATARAPRGSCSTTPGTPPPARATTPMSRMYGARLRYLCHGVSNAVAWSSDCVMRVPALRAAIAQLAGRYASPEQLDRAVRWVRDEVAAPQSSAAQIVQRPAMRDRRDTATAPGGGASGGISRLRRWKMYSPTAAPVSYSRSAMR